ncbi:hypothetical protein Ppa05_36040 [Planomonospora parontospora subsp. antibiotica]|nr:hypothetical protein Ppa05_36040 [Planomonospora parontospora subsp. antibiotica]
MPAPGRDDERTGGRGVGGEHRPGGEAALRVVGADLDGHIAAEPVRTADPAYDKLHARLLSVVSKESRRVTHTGG